MKKGSTLLAILVSVAMLLPFDVLAESDNSNSIGNFKDVSDRHWAKAAIEQAVAKGYVSGYQDGTFRPDKNITRAEVASILDRVTKLKTGDNPIVLPDMDKHWAKESVRRLISMGVISAADYSKGFEPNKAITRYELMKWMASGLAASDPSFKQALADTKATLLPTPESFKGGIKAAQIPHIALVRGTGIITGYSDGSLKPSDQATRAEVLTMIMKYAKIEGSNADAYSDLNEMRAVGVEKTNLEWVSDYKIEGDNKLTKIVGKTLSYPNLDIVIHRMIAVDLTTKDQKGLYAPLFVGKDRKPYQMGGYFFFFDSTIKRKTDTTDYLKLSGEINEGNNIYKFMRVDDDVTKRLGITVVPGDDTFKFLSKGTPRRIWSVGALSAENVSGLGGYIIANDGSKFSFSRPY